VASYLANQLAAEDQSGNLAIDDVRSHSGGDVVITSAGSITVGKEDDTGAWSPGSIAGGNIILIAAGEITQQVLPGQETELLTVSDSAGRYFVERSGAGGIGASEARPLVIDSGIANVVGAKVNVLANGNVFLEEAAGDLRVETIETTGDVYIKVVDGNLLDGNQQETRDQRTYDELKGGVWADLSLTRELGALDKVEAERVVLRSVKEFEYQTYWNFREQQPDPSVYDENFQVTLSADEVAFYTVFYGGGTAAEDAITTLENSRTQQYHDLHSEYGSINGGVYIESEIAEVSAVNGGTDTITFSEDHEYTSGQAIVYRNGGNAGIAIAGGEKLLDGSVYYVIVTGTDQIKLAVSEADALESTPVAIDFAEVDLEDTEDNKHLFRSGYIYTLNADEEAAVVADFKVWTEEELLYSVNDGLLKEVSDTTITIEDPNINGASVRLDVSGRIGEPSGSLDIDLLALRTATVIAEMSFSGATLTLTSHDNWASTFVKDKQIFIEGSGEGNSGPFVIESVDGDELTLKAVEGETFTAFTTETASVSVSITMTDKERVTLAAAERNDVTYLSEAPISVEVDFDQATNTITRVSGDSFNTISVGDFIQVFGTSENATTGQLFYRVENVTSTVITLADDSDENSGYDSANIVLTESRIDVQIAPVVVDPKLNVAGGINESTDTITLTAAHGYTTGSKIIYDAGGNATGDNAPIALSGGGSLTDGGTYYVIKVDNSSIKLATSYADAVAGDGNALDLVLSNTLGATDDAEQAIADNRTDNNIDTVNITLTLNSVAQTISIGASTDITTAEDLRAYLQAAVDDAIGEELVNVVLGTDNAIEFELDTLNSALGDHTISSTSFIKIARINLIEDFDVDASGTINAEADKQMFLGSEGSFNVNNLLAGSPDVGFEARIKVGEDILQSSSTGEVRASTLILEAGAGTIGIGPLNGGFSPLRVNIIGDGSLTARAAEDVVITETANNMPVGTIFADQGGVYLETLSGSIVDGFDQNFTNIKANVIVLEANGGGIGEDGDYLDIDVDPGFVLQPGDTVAANGFGTITATAEYSIYLSETVGDLNIRNIFSEKGDADLKADASILDAVDLAAMKNGTFSRSNLNYTHEPEISGRPVIDITARNVTLTAGVLGGIGVSGNDIDIDSSYSADGALSIGGSGLNAYVIEVLGDLGLNTISVGPNASGEIQTAYITAPIGSIYNRSASVDGINVTSGKIWLFAANNIGTFATPITTQASAIEGKSTSGNFVVDNTGAVEIGGVIEGSFNDQTVSGIVSGGEVWFVASSPVTLTENINADGDITVTSNDAAGNGDFILVKQDRNIVSNGGSVYLQSGDDITIETGATITAGGEILFTADYEKSDDETASELASILLTGATLDAGTSVGMVATGDITLTSFTDTSGTTPVTTATTVTAGSTFIDFSAGRDILINDPSGIAPTTLQAATSIGFDADQNILISAASWLNAGTSATMTAGQDISMTGSSTLIAGTLVDLDAASRDIRINGASTVTAGTSVAMKAGQNILIDGDSDISATGTAIRTSVQRVRTYP
jgi:hypothetical protein